MKTSTNPPTRGELRAGPGRPEFAQAIDALDKAERRIRRHQNMWACGPSTRPETSRHDNKPEIKAEHDQLIEGRDNARRAVAEADPKQPTAQAKPQKGNR